MSENTSSLGLPEVSFGTDAGVPVVRNFKDSVFRMLFNNKENLLSLYNALNGTNYDDPNELEINTLENAIYLGRKNDISFIIHNELHLYERQSTVNPNMALRSLFYLCTLYQKMVAGRDLHTSKAVNLPWPSCIVFYNGTQDQPDRMWMKLSDLYSYPQGSSPQICGLELIVQIININHGRNQRLMQACEVLKGYGTYVEKVRQYRKSASLEVAVERAVSECIREGILVDFLRKNQAEVKCMSIFEYNQEEHFRQLELDAIEVGLEKGLQQGLQRGLQQGKKQGKADAIIELLNDLGAVPDELQEQIRMETDAERLSKWLKSAAKVETVEQFVQRMS